MRIWALLSLVFVVLMAIVLPFSAHRALQLSTYYSLLLLPLLLSAACFYAWYLLATGEGKCVSGQAGVIEGRQ